ncbi:MAG: SseB family protein [Pseudomonadota bacterium]
MSLAATPLDRAIRAHLTAPEDDARNRAIYATFAAAELFLLLDAEPAGDAVKPQLFPLEQGQFAVAFDTEERLAAFAGQAAYVGLSGRAMAQMLKGQGISLALNLGTEAEHILPPDAFDWLVARAVAPSETPIQPTAFQAPEPDDADLIRILETSLAAAASLAERLVLLRATFADAPPRPALAVGNAAPGAEPALARLITEALAIAGRDPAEIDLAFLTDGPHLDRAIAVGLTVDLPELPAARPPSPPGSDPTRPPKLR